MGQAITIRQLAGRHGLSRATLLYYDRLGLLRPRGRSTGNYRLYSPTDQQRLARICLYRAMGVPLKEIARLLDQPAENGQARAILERRLATLEKQIESMQDQQRQILRLLERLPSSGRRTKQARVGPATTHNRKENTVVNKKRWVEIMVAAGFDEQAMHNWHRQFEKMEPEAHQEFLESLKIDSAEIARIRTWSRQ